MEPADLEGQERALERKLEAVRAQRHEAGRSGARAGPAGEGAPLLRGAAAGSAGAGGFSRAALIAGLLVAVVGGGAAVAMAGGARFHARPADATAPPAMPANSSSMPAMPESPPCYSYAVCPARCQKIHSCVAWADGSTIWTVRDFSTPSFSAWHTWYQQTFTDGNSLKADMDKLSNGIDIGRTLVAKRSRETMCGMNATQKLAPQVVPTEDDPKCSAPSTSEGAVMLAPIPADKLEVAQNTFDEAKNPQNALFAAPRRAGLIKGNVTAYYFKPILYRGDTNDFNHVLDLVKKGRGFNLGAYPAGVTVNEYLQNTVNSAGGDMLHSSQGVVASIVASVLPVSQGWKSEQLPQLDANRITPDSSSNIVLIHIMKDANHARDFKAWYDDDTSGQLSMGRLFDGPTFAAEVMCDLAAPGKEPNGKAADPADMPTDEPTKPADEPTTPTII